MKGRQKGRPTKWVSATISEYLDISRRGIQFEVWEKWKRKDRKLGTLTVSVGGIRWRPLNGKLSKQQNWTSVADWLAGSDDA
jgi:hypothetical protein